MKILHLITGLKTGGAEKQLYKMLLHDSVNHHIVVSLTQRDYYGELIEKLGISVYELNITKLFFVKGLIKLVDIFKKENPSIIQTWMMHSNIIGGLIAYIMGYKNIIWGIRVNIFPLKRGFYFDRILIFCSIILAKLIPQKIIFNSKKTMSGKYYKRYPDNKKCFIPNGIDTNIQNQVFKSSKKEEFKTISIGVVARWAKEKNHKGFFQAIKLLPIEIQNKINIKLFGRNMDTNNRNLKKMINYYKIEKKIQLFGFKKNINDIMSEIDLLVLSSLAEGFPNVILEGMLYGVPCVATDVGDSRDIVGDTGWIVPIEDSKELAIEIENAILQMSNRIGWNKRKLECSSKIIDNYSIKKMISSYQKHWKSI